MNTKKSKKAQDYISQQQSLIPEIISKLNDLQNKLTSACTDGDEDMIKEYAHTIQLYEMYMSQILSITADIVYVDVFKKNDITKYKVIEMVTPNKWIIDFCGEPKSIFRGNKTGYFTLDKHIAIPTARL